MHLTMTDLERAARKRLSAMAWGYCASGADDQTTLTDNLAAFDRIRLLPRVPVDVSDGGAATGDASCAWFAGAVCAGVASERRLRSHFGFRTATRQSPLFESTRRLPVDAPRRFPDSQPDGTIGMLLWDSSACGCLAGHACSCRGHRREQPTPWLSGIWCGGGVTRGGERPCTHTP